MMRFCRASRIVPILGVLIFVTTMRALGDTCSPVPQDTTNHCSSLLQACSAQSGGLDQRLAGSTVWPQITQAQVTLYNPTPVYLTSSAWVQLSQLDTGTRLQVQVGWTHNNGLSNSQGTVRLPRCLAAHDGWIS